MSRWAFYNVDIWPFRRLHLWLHGSHPLGPRWPGGICTVLNRLGNPVCIEDWQL